MGAVLALHLRISLDVKTLSNSKTIQLSVEPTQTIRSLKNRLSDHSKLPNIYKGIPLEKLKVVFDGYDLDDDRTLWECNVHKNPVVYIDNALLRKRKSGRRLANQRLIDRFIRESIRCQQS